MSYTVQCALCTNCSNAVQPVPIRPCEIKCNAGHRPAKQAVKAFPPVFDGEECINKVHACYDYVDAIRPYRMWHGEFVQDKSAYQLPGMVFPACIARVIDDEDEDVLDAIIHDDEQSDEHVPADWDEFEDMSSRLVDMYE